MDECVYEVIQTNIEQIQKGDILPQRCVFSMILCQMDSMQEREFGVLPTLGYGQDEDENGVFRQESPFKFTAFQEFAYRKMKIFAEILSGSFSFKLVSDENNTANYITTLTLHIDGGLHVHAAYRFRHSNPRLS
ncbi:Cytochrome [Forsythia ovata]|uniref:Cytochrome n=1 Tax=Forsythia ovata TaxID=205694 RepID=A0ABD1SAG2_9LAMI